jgi:hypothetical protein
LWRPKIVADVDDLTTNRAHWDAMARVHGQDAYYDTEALVAGADALEEHESAAVGDVAGLDLLHLQSHIAFDSISLARRGARVTCVDFSPESLAAAGHLADRCGVALELVEADAAALPSSLDGFDGPRRFDEPGSYADPDADVTATATVEYAHSLGEVVTAAIGAGLRIDASRPA